MESLLTVVPDITARHKESGGYRCPKACDFLFACQRTGLLFPYHRSIVSLSTLQELIFWTMERLTPRRFLHDANRLSILLCYELV